MSLKTSDSVSGKVKGTTPAGKPVKSTNVTMKTSTAIASLTLSAAVLALTGCVDPYYAGGGGVAVTSNYRPGYSVTSLPRGYRTEVISGTSYYQHGGVYYRPKGRGYVVVDAPHRGPGSYRPGPVGDRDRDGRPNWRDPRPNVPSGQVIRRLPGGYRVVDHRGSRYYRVGDTYYQSQGGGYIVVGRPF
jgi:hypothetical protein